MLVKICGITCEADAHLACEAGASALGYNFYPKSPRYVSPNRAAEIVKSTGPGYLRVGVFVNPRVADLSEALERVPLDIVQLHGRQLPQLPPHIRIWRAIAPASAPPESHMQPEAYLLDTPSHHFGGSGLTFSWSLAAGFPARAIIAGGLDHTNVAEAIRIAKPWGVDACSRLETLPGRKDPARVRAFVTTALESFKALAEAIGVTE
jgi:phosphoribosylanthranilate isomerase